MNLRRSMFHLYALLTTPPPLSTSYLALHLALISGYTVFLHAEGWLQIGIFGQFLEDVLQRRRRWHGAPD